MATPTLCSTASTSKTSMADWAFGEPRLATLPVDGDSKTIRGNVKGAVFSVARPTPWKVGVVVMVRVVMVMVGVGWRWGW